MTTLGVLLAAGAGTRMGRPKALVSDERGSWLPRAVEALRDGGCERVLVVLGASAEQARPLLDSYDVTVLVAEDWEDGMGASLAAGLRYAEHGAESRCLVSLVDLPDVGADVVGRVNAVSVDRDALARAAYHGRPGHPVLIGRSHWAGVLATSAGDVGARDYLAAREVLLVECGDLASGEDVDRFTAGTDDPTSPGPTPHQPRAG